LYTNYFKYNPKHGKPFFVDVTNQTEKIIAVLDIYAVVYGNWSVKQYVMEQLMLFERMVVVQYTEAFTKIMWRTALPYLY